MNMISPRKWALWLSRATAVLLLTPLWMAGQNDPNRKDWIQAFNGKNLDGWVMKITGFDLGENYGNTFRVENGIMKVSYDEYPEFGGKFGHIFYRAKFSHYIIGVEYRFVGEQVKNGPGWAVRNNGIMLHSQAPETMGKNQDFPISIEVQLLAGGPTGERPTANVCTPGTEIFMNGSMVRGHCTQSKSQTYRGDQWVRVEAEVLGSERVRHMIDGKVVLEYEKLQIGGGQVNNFDSAIKKDGAPLGEGYISLQGESHPTEFRKIEILNLSGCMDPKASNFKAYFVHAQNAQCVYGPAKK
jgi:3-keto-disaccharide hydrolase